jgi:hypothetical protein
MGLPEPKSLTQTKGASSSAYADKLKELGAMIKGTAKPISDYARKKEYRLSQPKTKGASYVNPTDRIERQVKLGELGKMIKGL